MVGSMRKSKRDKSEQRHYNMLRIRSKNTKIEVRLRKTLWHLGIRYRINYAALPGKPDIAITKHNIAIFCDGEFWHGKDWENKRETIHSNREYWIPKIERNMKRDTETDRELTAMGWQVLHFWGGDIMKRLDDCIDDVQDAILQSIILNSDIAANLEGCDE